MPAPRLQHRYPLPQPLILRLQLAFRHLYLIRVLHRMIHQIQSVIRAISFLLDDCHIFSEGLLGIL